MGKGKGEGWRMFSNASQSLTNRVMKELCIYVTIKFVDQSQEMGWSFLVCRFANGITESNSILILCLQFWFEYEFLITGYMYILPPGHVSSYKIIFLMNLVLLPFYFDPNIACLDLNSNLFLRPNRCPIATWKTHGHKTVLSLQIKNVNDAMKIDDNFLNFAIWY